MLKDEYLARKKALLHYFPECGGMAREGWCLHHKDPSWRKNDLKRYKEWRIEDLIPLTIAEHASLHDSLSNPSIKYGSGFKGKHFSPEAKEKLRAAHLGKHHTEEAKKKISLHYAGGPKNGHLSEEAKDKLRKAISGRVWVNNGIVNKQVFPNDIPEGFVRGRISRKNINI